MPAGLMTSADVLEINNSEELFGVINEVIQENPELSFFGASPMTKNQYQSIRMTELPATSFRQPNTTRKVQSAVFEPTITKCAYLDASWLQDCAISEQHDWGKEAAWAIQTKAHIQSAFFNLSKQIWYGVAKDPNGFIGVKALLDEFASAGLSSNASSATANLSSVYAVRTSLEDAQIAWGSEGKFDEGEVRTQWVSTAKDEGYNAYCQKLGGWCGFQVVSQWAIGRLAKLSTGANQGLTDDMLFNLIAKFPSAKLPHAFFMSRRSLFQLRESRTAVNATGAPAPIPTEVAGIPILTSDAISDAEETIV